MRNPLLLVASLSLGLSSAACVVENRPPPPPPANNTSQAVQSQPSGNHPAYLHALSDLRYARAQLEAKGGEGQQKWDERAAVDHIDQAINEIKRAAIDDGKPLSDHPAVDANENRAGKLHRALATLQKARGDIEHEEDNGSVHGLRDRAIHQIDEAIRLTKDGINAS